MIHAESFFVTEYGEQALIDGSEQIATSHSSAAETYFETRHADFDYASECQLWVWQRGDTKARKFIVTAEQTTHFYTKELTP